MRIFLLTLFLYCISATCEGQLPSKVMNEMGPNPIFYLDSVEVDMAVIMSLNPRDISNITVIRPKKAKKILGEKGNNGAFYIVTRKLARLSYWRYLSSKSREYRSLFPTLEDDSLAQYVLNGEVLLDKSAIGALYLLTNDNFKSLDILDKTEGKFHFDNVYPNRFLVLIRAKRKIGRHTVKQKK